MTVLPQEACQQLELFLWTLFLADELIESRFIESWISAGKKRSRVVRSAEWLRRDEFVAQHPEIAEFAKRERANVYFGVCPRPRKGDAQDDSIRTVRCVWCDIDDLTVDEAFERWATAGAPVPSIVVSSGSGIHGYWLLEDDVRSQSGRALITAMLPYFYRSFDGDHVQNLSRILRPPGTVNYKDARNGRPPQPSTLLTCEPERRYRLTAFARWIAMAKRKQRQTPVEPVSAGSPKVIPASVDAARQAEVMEVVQHLDRPSGDRSRRDFAVVCDLLRLGLTSEEIWPLVARASKFESNGRPYFDVTVANAERTVLVDQSTPRRIGASA